MGYSKQLRRKHDHLLQAYASKEQIDSLPGFKVDWSKGYMFIDECLGEIFPELAADGPNELSSSRPDITIVDCKNRIAYIFEAKLNYSDKSKKIAKLQQAKRKRILEYIDFDVVRINIFPGKVAVNDNSYTKTFDVPNPLSETYLRIAATSTQ